MNLTFTSLAVVGFMFFRKVIILVVFLSSLLSEIWRRIEQIILMMVCSVVKWLMLKSEKSNWLRAKKRATAICKMNTKMHCLKANRNAWGLQLPVRLAAMVNE